MRQKEIPLITKAKTAISTDICILRGCLLFKSGMSKAYFTIPDKLKSPELSLNKTPVEFEPKDCSVIDESLVVYGRVSEELSKRRLVYREANSIPRHHFLIVKGDKVRVDMALSLECEIWVDKDDMVKGYDLDDGIYSYVCQSERSMRFESQLDLSINVM